MEENKVTKVVTTLTTGKATPIVVKKTDAYDLAKNQSIALEEQHEEQVRQLKIKEGEVTTEQPVINKTPQIKKEDLPIETQAAVEELYAPKVMYHVVEQKTNWKLAAILGLVLLGIIIILVIELSVLT